VHAAVLGEAATYLDWLPPNTSSLLVLARACAVTAWDVVRHDPGGLLLAVRHLPADAAFSPALLRDPAILESTAHWLDSATTGLVDWSRPELKPIHHAAIRYARLSGRLAETTQLADPEHAWIAGLLAPLGWLAVCAIDADVASQCLHDPRHADHPAAAERAWWGLDQSAIARRLARRWRLPPWLTQVIGHLSLPAETAESLGADPNLLRVVQLAILLTEKEKLGLGLEVGSPLQDLCLALRLSAEDVKRHAQESLAETVPEMAWSSPASVPLLRDLLLMAAENRRLSDTPVLERLEREVDRLHQALAEQRASEAHRLQTLKLETLAEFAAGAGHEINNPLAVISGQAQYLLGYEDEPSRQQSLQKIIQQAQRIHELLTELMQFARPPKPSKKLVDLGALIREVTISLGDRAAHKPVKLVCPEPERPVGVQADSRLLKTALTCLLRNAIEAAPPDGWAGIRVTTPSPDCIDVLVEDSGAGPTAAQRDHMFDPFYSGRTAGRGRGLGLPTAWRLAKEQGGDVLYDDRSGSPTRFILRLPRQTEVAPPALRLLDAPESEAC
jgi:signal transduction histidine kinase